LMFEMNAHRIGVTAVCSFHSTINIRWDSLILEFPVAVNKPFYVLFFCCKSLVNVVSYIRHASWCCCSPFTVFYLTWTPGEIYCLKAMFISFFHQSY
jgi:hypothetical protein